MLLHGKSYTILHIDQDFKLVKIGMHSNNTFSINQISWHIEHVETQKNTQQY